MTTRVKASAPNRAYPDMHDFIEALDEAGLLIRVDGPINKDTELHPLVRLCTLLRRRWHGVSG